MADRNILLTRSAYLFTALAAVGLVGISFVAISVLINPGVGLSVSVALTMALLVDGLANVPVVHKAAPKFLGQRLTGVVLHEGWWWLPLRFIGFWDLEIVFVGLQNIDLDGDEHPENDKRTRVPLTFLSDGNITMTVEAHLTYFAHDPITFMNAGTNDGVDDVASDILRDSLREWGSKLEWVEIAKAQQAIYMREVIRDLRTSNDEPSDDDIRDAVSGNGKFVNDQLGVTFVRINISEITAPQDILGASQDIEREEREREAEIIQNEAVVKMVTRQVEAGIPMSEAVRSVQLERDKGTTKVIDERVIGVSGVLEGLLAQLIPNITGRKDDENA